MFFSEYKAPDVTEFNAQVGAAVRSMKSVNCQSSNRPLTLTCTVNELCRDVLTKRTFPHSGLYIQCREAKHYVVDGDLATDVYACVNLSPEAHRGRVRDDRAIVPRRWFMEALRTL